jgi:hypothetical protein
MAYGVDGCHKAHGDQDKDNYDAKTLQGLRLTVNAELSLMVGVASKAKNNICGFEPGKSSLV